MTQINTNDMVGPATDPSRTFRLDGPDLEAQLWAALVDARTDLPVLKKDAKSGYGGDYSYASADFIIGCARQRLAQHDLAVIITKVIEIPIDGAKGEQGVGDRSMLHIDLILSHRSGATVRMHRQLQTIPGKGRPEDKASLSAQTKALSYVYRDLLGIEREESDDDLDARDDTGYGATKAPARSSKAMTRRQISMRPEATVAPLASGMAVEKAAPVPAEATPVSKPKVNGAMLGNLLLEKGQAGTADEATEMVKVWGRQHRSRPTQANIREAMAQVDRGEMLLEVPGPLTMTDADVDAVMPPPTAVPNGDQQSANPSTHQMVVDIAAAAGHSVPQVVAFAKSVGLVFDENMPVQQLDFMRLQLEKGMFHTS